MTYRITRPQMFMQIAEIVARRSTCFRRSIGAVLVTNNDIISYGYNGPPAGEDHCYGATCVPAGQVGCVRALHAEANAIDRMPPQFRPAVKTMYTTESPCLACASKIVELGTNISTLYYLNEYRVRAGIEHLVANGVTVYRMTPSGYIINAATNELVELVGKA